MKTILVDLVHTFFIKGEGIFKEMHDLLDEYPNPKVILTSASDEQVRDLGLENMPYPVFTLKHNPEKSNPEYYSKFLEEYGFKPEEVIYFEHDKEAVESAKSVGIETFVYDSEARDLLALREFIESNS